MKADLPICSVKMKWIFGIFTVFLFALWIVPSLNQDTKAGDQHPNNEQDDAQSHIEKILSVHEIVPDVVDDATGVALLQVVYADGVEVHHGDELKPTQVRDQPVEVQWPAEKDEYYTLILADPDAPNRKTHEARSWQHWIVCNIKGNDLKTGTVLTEYIGAAPPEESGLHRYVFLLYVQQEGKAEFNREFISKIDPTRGSFSVREFAAEHHLGKPIAINFFEAQYDDYVKVVQKQLSSG